MSNIFYADGVTYKDTQGTTYGRLVSELVQQVAPRRPGLSFVFSQPAECLVYNGTPDMTCKDYKSVKYVGCIYKGYGSRRGGQGWRASVVLTPVNADTIETVSLDKATKVFLSTFTAVSYAQAIERFETIACNVIARLRSESRRNIKAHVDRLLSDMSDIDMATQCYDILSGTSTPEVWKANMPEGDIQTLLRTTMFGSKYEKLACVMQVGDLYVVKHGDTLTEYAADTLPTHMARSVGMLKLVGTDKQLMAGYGIPLGGNAYAVSITEVEV